MNGLKKLPKHDLIRLLSICDEVRQVEKIEQFQRCIQELKNIVLFEGALSIYIDKGTLGQKNIPETFSHTVDFSKKFIKKYLKGRHYVDSAVCNAMLKTWQPQHWKTAWDRDIEGKGARSMQLAIDHGYQDGWASANYHPVNNCISIFVLGGQKADKDRRTAIILEYLTPHFAEAIKEIFHQNLTKYKSIKSMKITSRELEVLKWIEQGKSTWDVSVILNRSERVIKWHVKNIMRKLSAQNRTHAVAIALRHGLID